MHHESLALTGRRSLNEPNLGYLERSARFMQFGLGLMAALSCVLINTPAIAQDASSTVELTATGAEKAANKDGTIPVWEGGLQQAPKGWSPDKGYIDPFPTDRPQLIISAQNMDAHKGKLSPGLQSLLTAYPDFRLPVYQTRRTAAIPAAVTEVVQKEAPNIKTSGDFLIGRVLSTIPFPKPQNGVEVMWNHRLRYRGGGVDHEEFWYPVRDGKIVHRVGYSQRMIENSHLDTPTPNGIVYVRARFTAPAMLSHSESILHETLDSAEDARNWWVVNDAQRRVRRLTAAGYDDMPIGVEDLRTRDQTDGFNGAFNRYDWKLLGKKEMLVPYNIFKLSDKRLAPEHVFGQHSVKPDFMRYELHRVWVVEATLKPTMRHLYPKRTFYVDEDSWSILLEDVYDARGKLWRVGIHGLTQFYDVQVPAYRVNIWHDLANSDYLVSGLDLESKKPRKFGIKGTLADFTPDQLNNREGVK